MPSLSLKDLHRLCQKVRESRSERVLHRAYRSKNWNLRLALVNNPHCPPGLLAKLAALPVEPVPICGLPAVAPSSDVGIEDKWREIRNEARRRMRNTCPGG